LTQGRGRVRVKPEIKVRGATVHKAEAKIPA
jgi:hypothetical protein